jgi:ABC-type amino acid transport substrate-binding protein
LFKESKDAWVIPDNHIEDIPDNTFLSRTHFSKAIAMVFSKSKLISSLEQLKLESFSYTRGSPFDYDIEEFRYGVAVQSEHQSFKLLLKGRVSAVVAWLPDAQDYVDNTSFLYDPNLIIGQVVDRILCFDTPANRYFIEHFDDEIKTMKESGELTTILGRAYLH